MSQNKLAHLTVFGIGFLVIGLSVVSLKLYDFSLKNKQLKVKISLEKSIHQNQISEILKRYDSLKEFRSENFGVFKSKTVSLLTKKPNKQPFLAAHTATKNAMVNNLKAINMNARGVRLVSKDVVETSVASKIDQVRVRFTLEENKDIEPGDKHLFIEILNPKNRLLALKGKIETKFAEEIYYDGLNTDACLFINLHQHQLIVGEYKINLIYKGDIIGSANFRVN